MTGDPDTSLTIDTYHHILPDFFWRETNDSHAPVGGLTPLQWFKEAMISFMDDAGIDVAVMSVSTPGVRSRKPIMSKHVTISPNEAADRLAIRELVEAYAHCADRRDAKAQMALFTKDTHFVVYMNAKDPTPSQELHSREALAPVFAELKQYDATTHFIGQSTIFTLTDERATGEAYCLAHHVTVDGDKRRLMLASLRYLDTFTKVDGSWLFAERQLCVDWLEQRSMS
jgi:hypothetical protein